MIGGRGGLFIAIAVKIRERKKRIILARRRNESEKEKRGRGANESRVAAAIAGRVIERKRNYGVHGAASRGSRVITHRHRGAIVP